MDGFPLDETDDIYLVDVLKKGLKKVRSKDEKKAKTAYPFPKPNTSGLDETYQ